VQLLVERSLYYLDKQVQQQLVVVLVVQQVV